MQAGPIDIDKYEYASEAQIQMKNSIGEGKDALERNRYIEKQRSSQTIMIIGDPRKMNQIYRDILRDATQELLYEMGREDEMYYGTAIHHLGRYIWKLADYLPE